MSSSTGDRKSPQVGKLGGGDGISVELPTLIVTLMPECAWYSKWQWRNQYPGLHDLNRIRTKPVGGMRMVSLTTGKCVAFAKTVWPLASCSMVPMSITWNPYPCKCIGWGITPSLSRISLSRSHRLIWEIIKMVKVPKVQCLWMFSVSPYLDRPAKRTRKPHKVPAQLNGDSGKSLNHYNSLANCFHCNNVHLNHLESGLVRVNLCLLCRLLYRSKSVLHWMQLYQTKEHHSKHFMAKSMFNYATHLNNCPIDRFHWNWVWI